MERSKAKADKFRFIDEEKAGESYSLAQMYIFMRSRTAARACEDFRQPLAARARVFRCRRVVRARGIGRRTRRLSAILLRDGGDKIHGVCRGNRADKLFCQPSARRKQRAKSRADCLGSLLRFNRHSRSARRGLFAKRHCVFSRRLRSRGRDDIFFLAFARAH